MSTLLYSAPRPLDGVDVMILHVLGMPVLDAFKVLQTMIGPPNGDPKLLMHPSVMWWIQMHAAAVAWERRNVTP